MTSTRIAVIGGSGQAARALASHTSSHQTTIIARGRPGVDITDYRSVATYLYETQPNVVVNAAAYTAVDKAEKEPDAAFRANAEGPARLAVLCSAARVPLIHISTDYVFDGTKAGQYGEDDPLRPLNVYGATKAAGEDAIRAGCPQHVIIRTTWLYGPDGQNFLRTMLRLGEERDVVRVVDDQHGAPTDVESLAGAIVRIAEAVAGAGPAGPWGTYHVTAAGETTWHGFASEIYRLAAEAGLRTPRLEPIPTSDYPTDAIRPHNSRLDNSKVGRAFGIALSPWQEGLSRIMSRVVAER